MFWSFLISARARIAPWLAAALIVASPWPSLAPSLGASDAIAQSEQSDDRPTDEAKRPAEPAKPAQRLQEIIIDDSGIVIREGDDGEATESDEDGGGVVRHKDRRIRFSDEYSDEEQVTFGEDVLIDEDEVINQNMVVLFGDLRVYGRVVGDIVVVMGDVNLYEGSEVTGDILCVGGEIDSEPGAQVFGEVTPISLNFLDMIGTSWSFAESPFHGDGGNYSFGDAILKLLQILALAGVGLLLLAKRIPNLSAALRRRGGRSLLVGLLTLLVCILLLIPAVLVIVLLVLTLVGIPVAVLAILAIIGLCYLSIILPIYAFSRYTFEARGMNRFLSVGIWAGIFWLLFSFGQALSLGGFLGFLQFLLFLFGMGALVMTRLGTRAVVPE